MKPPSPQSRLGELVERLRSLYSHRGDGIPTQYVNPDGPEAADALEALQRAAQALLDRLYRSHLPSDAALPYASVEWADTRAKADALRQALSQESSR